MEPVSPQDELKKFLEQFSQPIEEKVETFTQPVQAPERPIIQFDEEPEYTPVEFDVPLATPASQAVEVDSYAIEDINEIEEIDEEHTYKTRAEIGSEAETSSCTLSSIRNKSLLVSVKNMQMPMLKMPNIHQTHNAKKSLHAPNLKSKAALKDSIIGQLILGAPKAMERPEQEVFH